jgi:hypothetical protein
MKALSRVLPVVGGVIVLVTQGMSIDGVSAHRAEVRRTGGDGIDSKMTNEYLRTTRSYLLAIEGSMESVDKAIGKELRTIGRLCPNVAANAPLNLSRSRVDGSIVDTLAITVAHADMAIVMRWRTRVSHLHWSNPRVTDIVQRSAQAADVEATLKKPSLCESLRAWARGHFLRVPHGLVEFSRKAEAISESVTLFPNVLAGHEDRQSHKMVREVKSLQLTVGRELRVRVINARKEILKRIGLVRGKTAEWSRSWPIEIRGGEM